jgi:hypothetical protein
MSVMKGITIGGRALTQAQRGTFDRMTKRIFSKALSTLGREAEEIVQQEMHGSEDHLITSATFKLNEVVYRITITGTREEATS